MKMHLGATFQDTGGTCVFLVCCLAPLTYHAKGLSYINQGAHGQVLITEPHSACQAVL